MFAFLFVLLSSVVGYANYQLPLQAPVGPIYIEADTLQESLPEIISNRLSSKNQDYGYSSLWALYQFKSSYNQYPISLSSCHQCHKTQSFLFLGDSLIHSWGNEKSILSSSPSKLRSSSKELSLLEGLDYKLWVNMKSNYSIDTKLEVQDYESNLNDSYHFLIWTKIYIGIILALITSHLLFLFAFRNKTFLFYLLFECSTTLITLYYNSIESYLIPINLNHNTLLFFFAFAYLGLTQFTFHFLKISSHRSLILKTLKQAPYFYLLIPIAQLIFSNFHFPFFEIFIVQMITVSALCLIKVFKRHSESLSLLLALSAFIVSLCVVYLKNKYLLWESLDGQTHIIHFTGHIAMILIITAPIVSKILKQIKQSNHEVQKSSLHQLQLISNLKSELKIKSNARTIHLDHPIPEEKLNQLDLNIQLYSLELEQAIAKMVETKK